MTASVRRRSTGRLAQIMLLRVLFVLAIVAAWVIAYHSGSVPVIVLPALEDVLVRLAELVQEKDTWDAAFVTAFEMLAGFIIAASLGLSIGFVLARTALSTAVFERLFAWGYIFPTSLVYPLFLVWAGVGISSKILFAALAGFFPIVYNTMKGLSTVPANYLRVSRAFGASHLQTDVQVKLGAARPMILAGLRLGASMTTISVVLAEILGANAGLGFLAQQAAAQFQIVNSYAFILLLMVLTSVLLWLIETLFKERNYGQPR